MHNIDLSGCGTALVTPFKNGAVDFDAYRALVRRQVAGGIDFLVPLGTTAETPTLSADEKVALFNATREEAPGKILVAGAGSNSLQGTLANIELLTPCKPDAWLIVVPFYNKPSQEGIYQYYKAVSEATDIPVLMYNVPGRTGVNMDASTCIRLAKLPNIIGVKILTDKRNHPRYRERRFPGSQRKRRRDTSSHGNRCQGSHKRCVQHST